MSEEKEQLGLQLEPKRRRRAHRVADTSLAAKGNGRGGRARSAIKALILEHVRSATNHPSLLGATADEVHQWSATDQSEIADIRRLMNIRRRVSDLAGEGKIRETALRRPNADGNPTIVWSFVNG